MENLGPKRKILIYFYHCRTFGHTRRVFNIAQALAEDPANEVLVISGGESTTFFKPHMQFELIQIPALVPDQDSFNGYHPRMKSISTEKILKWRASLLEQCLENFVPDVLMLEMFPFDRLGLEKEFLQLIHSSRRFNPFVKVISSVRDIPETENEYWKNKQDLMKSILKQEIDHVYVHGMKDIFDYALFLEHELAAKICYTGYVVSPGFEKYRVDSKKSHKGVISIGGGKDGHQLLELFLQYLNSFAQNKISWTIIFGDYFSDQEKIELSLKEHSNVTIQKNIIIQGGFLKDYGVHICMAGYNTLIENISMGMTPIVYARTSSGEQKLRSSIFEKNQLCHVITSTSTASDLAHLITRELTSTLIPTMKMNLTGASTTRDLIADLV